MNEKLPQSPIKQRRDDDASIGCSLHGCTREGVVIRVEQNHIPSPIVGSHIRDPARETNSRIDSQGEGAKLEVLCQRTAAAYNEIDIRTRGADLCRGLKEHVESLARDKPTAIADGHCVRRKVKFPPCRALLSTTIIFVGKADIVAVRHNVGARAEPWCDANGFGA